MTLTLKVGCNTPPCYEKQSYKVKMNSTGSCMRYCLMGESSKFQKSRTLVTLILKLAVCPLNIHNLKFKWSIVFRQTDYKSENIL